MQKSEIVKFQKEKKKLKKKKSIKKIYLPNEKHSFFNNIVF